LRMDEAILQPCQASCPQQQRAFYPRSFTASLHNRQTTANHRTDAS